MTKTLAARLFYPLARIIPRTVSCGGSPRYYERFKKIRNESLEQHLLRALGMSKTKLTATNVRWQKFNPWEQDVLLYLRDKESATLKEIRDTVFTSAGKEAKYAHNALRRPIRAKCISRVGWGVYKITAKGIRLLPKNADQIATRVTARVAAQEAPLDNGPLFAPRKVTLTAAQQVAMEVEILRRLEDLRLRVEKFLNLTLQTPYGRRDGDLPLQTPYGNHYQNGTEIHPTD